MRKILVVDDEPDILKVLAFRLKKAGYEVIQAELGKKAIALVRAERPDLVVLDYRLPDITGVDIARLMRADEKLKRIPIILLTASSGEDMSAVIMEADVNEFMKKPFDPEELLEKVRMLIGE